MRLPTMTLLLGLSTLAACGPRDAVGHGHCGVDVLAGFARRHRNAVGGKELLALIFEKIHLIASRAALMSLV